MDKKHRVIAFYLPQYHPIPENDRWWGKGFTEWTNVTKARPLFDGHYQPHLPAGLGFYDLRVPEARIEQADLAGQHGVEGFCYWHYWFAGKRLLERPFNEVLLSGQPDFPFCLAWANHTWSGTWYGASGQVLIEQTYPGRDDHEKHFHAVLPAFHDQRYIKVKGKPVFLLYRPHDLPDAPLFVDYWRSLAVKNGLPGLYFIGINEYPWRSLDRCFDGGTSNPPVGMIRNMQSVFKRGWLKVTRAHYKQLEVYDYEAFVENAFPPPLQDRFYFPCVLPNWDNTPRCGERGFVLHNSSPDVFARQLKDAIKMVEERDDDEKFIFVKSWNEWAEGNYLEPDDKWGLGYLEALKRTCG